jgi:DNA-binding NtrC family response regulator
MPVDATDEPVVLIVEDEDSLREMYKHRLEMGETKGLDIRTAGGGPQAVEMLSDEIDVALLDRRMPEMTGDEVLEKITESQYDIRTAMVTAVEPDYDIVDMGFDTYVVKPVDDKTIVETVNDLISRSQYEESMQELFTLMSKKAVLESKKSSSELGQSDEFSHVINRIEQLQDSLADDMADVEAQTNYSGFHEEF